MKLAQVTGSDEPGNVSGEIRPPKVIYYVGSCHKVAMMPSCIVGGGKDHRLFIGFNDDLMIPLQIFPPKVAILQEEVQCGLDEHGIHFLSEVSRLVQGGKPIMDVT